MSNDRRTITAEVIRAAVKRLHPVAFVCHEPEQPVLVDDGHCWLLFFDEHECGYSYTCDGADMGIIADQTQLEQILVTVAGAYRELDARTLEHATRHTADLVRLSGAEVYRRAREHALAQLMNDE